MNICKNCQNQFDGNFCNQCGEKIILESDFSFKALLFQAFGAITSVDSKLFKTFGLLFRSPGYLSKKITSGIRVPYLQPFQVFVLCNLLFFIFLGDTDLFRTPSRWFFYQDFDFSGTKVMDKVESIMQTEKLSFEEVESEYDAVSSNLSKSLLVLLIPFIALIGFVIKRKFKFGQHLIFATIYFSQFLLCTTVLYLITTNLPITSKWYFIVPMILSALVYYVVSIKDFYEKSLFSSVLFGIGGILFLLLIISFYRNMVNIISLELL